MVPGLVGLQLHRKQCCLQTTGHQVKPPCGCDAKTSVIFGPILHERLVINYNRYFMHSLSISHVPSLEDTAPGRDGAPYNEQGRVFYVPLYTRKMDFQ